MQEVRYVGSYPSISSCPKDERPEYAFIGRSNVGKSSLINMLLGRRALARVSKTPGKTQHLNFYMVDGAWYVVDLPGYGYARISKKKRHEWEKIIEGYLQKRRTLQCAFVLVDACVKPQLIDVEFINWMGKARIPFVIVYTKTDKLKNRLTFPSRHIMRVKRRAAVMQIGFRIKCHGAVLFLSMA